MRPTTTGDTMRGRMKMVRNTLAPRIGLSSMRARATPSTISMVIVQNPKRIVTQSDSRTSGSASMRT